MGCHEEEEAAKYWTETAQSLFYEIDVLKSKGTTSVLT